MDRSPSRGRSASAAAYLAACSRDHVTPALELIDALDTDAKLCDLSRRNPPLCDADLLCAAEGLRFAHSVRGLDLEESNFTLLGLQALIDALASNPGILRELRLGKNALKDPGAVVLGNALSLTGLGVKVLDLSENGITKLGALSLAQAISSRSSDIVELSLHNNDLAAEAAVALAQAIRSSGKLKHLHLGYNSLKDVGATQLARCLPIASTLVTLDLTANHIGPQGGQELVRALTSGTTTLQRLNLRHNHFDDETLQLFAEVLLRNTSLTQLFLGYMPASTETSSIVLSALRHNKTLLCLDICGWELDIGAFQATVEELLFHNLCVRALLVDGVEHIQDIVDVANGSRLDRSIHAVYIGSDDAEAADASSNRGSNQAKGAGTAAAAPRSASQASVTTRVSPVPRQSAQQQQQQQHQHQHPASVSHVPTTAAPYGAIKFPADSDAPVEYASCSRDIDLMMQELQRVDFDPQLRNRLLLIISQLQLKIEIQRSYQQQQIVALEERVRLLEQRDRSSRSSSTAANAAASRSNADLVGTARMIRGPYEVGAATAGSRQRHDDPIPTSADPKPSDTGRSASVASAAGMQPQRAFGARASGSRRVSIQRSKSPSESDECASNPAMSALPPSLGTSRNVSAARAVSPAKRFQSDDTTGGDRAGAEAVRVARPQPQPHPSTTRFVPTSAPGAPAAVSATSAGARRQPISPHGNCASREPEATAGGRSGSPKAPSLGAQLQGTRGRSTSSTPLVKPTANHADLSDTHEPPTAVPEVSAPTPDLQPSKPLTPTAVIASSPCQQAPPPRPRGARAT